MNLKNIRKIFFPTDIGEKYIHIGYSYPSVPKGWVNIVEDFIKKADVVIWGEHLPKWVKRCIYYLSTGGIIYNIRNRFWYNIYKKLSNNTLITDIKEKYAGIRIYYMGGNEELDYLIDRTELLCSQTCERCGGGEDVEVVGSSWIENLCKKCRINQKTNI